MLPVISSLSISIHIYPFRENRFHSRPCRSVARPRMVQAAQIAGDSADLTWDPGVQVMRGPGPPRLQDVTEARLVVIEKTY